MTLSRFVVTRYQARRKSTQLTVCNNKTVTEKRIIYHKVAGRKGEKRNKKEKRKRETHLIQQLAVTAAETKLVYVNNERGGTVVYTTTYLACHSEEGKGR